MKKLIQVVVSTLLLSTGLHAQGVRLDFSVYYPGPAHQAEGKGNSKAGLKFVSDLHYALGKKNIALNIKQGRQTIVYPYYGASTFSLFRVKAGDGDAARDVIASVSIPRGVKKAVFMLLEDSKKAGGYRIHPFWINKNAGQKGTIRIVNQSGRDVGLHLDKGKTAKHLLKKNAAYTVRGKFKGGQKDWFTSLEGYVTQHQDKPYKFKALHRDLVASKDDTSLYVVVRKQKKFLELLDLSLNGANIPSEQRNLDKQITPEDLQPQPTPNG